MKQEVIVTTPEEAIETIRANMPTSGYQMLRESLNMAVQAMEEIQQYRAIGTLEECKEAMEKQKVKPLEEKVNPNFPHLGKMYYCACGVAYLEKGAKYCGNCGQRIDWG